MRVVPSRPPWALPVATRSRPRRNDAGFTLVEMSVAMLLMGVLMTMIVSGMIHLTNTTMETEAVRDASDQLNIVFLDLDSDVRYAYQVQVPYEGTTSGGSYDGNYDVEFESTFNGQTQASCTELQYDSTNGELLQATWSAGETTYIPTFKMLANDLTSTSQPFQIATGASNQTEVQLIVTLSASSGSGAGRETSSSSVTFTALNSTSSTAVADSGASCTASWTST